MGICLTQYRIIIGCFNICRLVVTCCSMCISFLLIYALFLIFVIIILLITSGDVELNPGPINEKFCKLLNVCHVHIRSLSQSKLLTIKTSLSNVYDIITLSETHLHAGLPNDLFNIAGYHDIIRKDRDGHGGGVAVFIKENII